MSDQETASASRCPHLGLIDDPYTAYSYPAPNHQCIQTKAHEAIQAEYQLQFCLSSRHPQCPLFHDSAVNTLPKEAQQNPSSNRSSLNSSLVAISLIALFLLLLGLLLLIASQF